MVKFLRRQLARADRQEYAAIAVIAGVFVLFFYPVFFRGKYFVINDAFVELYPLRTVIWQELRDGKLPLWTPLVLSGYPILSMAQNAIGYPLTWGHLFLPPRWAEQIYTLTPFLLTPAFIYAYGREIKRSRLGSLLAGLTFGYGGLMVSAVANNGLLNNAVMWLPLMLIGIERARTRSFRSTLLLTTGAYSMSLLTGVGQGFLYVGLIAVGYALFLVAASSHLPSDDIGPEWKDPKRFKPLAVVFGAIALSTGVASFQIFETMRAAQLSIRRVLRYDQFTEGAYTLTQWFKAFLFPLHYVNNATPYVAPLVMLLVLAAVVAFARNPVRDIRVLFWILLAIVGWLLMLGPNTPIYSALYHVPILNSFRAPARNAIEWTFAIAILGGYGWDAAKAALSGSSESPNPHRHRLTGIAFSLVILNVLVMLLWRWDFARITPLWDESNHYPAYPEIRYLLWKLVFALLALAAVWVGLKVRSPRPRSALVGAVIVLVCFAEPSIMASRWWWPALKTRDQFIAPSATTQFLMKYPSEEYRVYTRANLWREEYEQQRRLDPGNLTMLYGLRNVGGYEPLMLERYSRALGNVWMDASSPLRGYRPNTALFDSRSHVLDILNTAFVVTYSQLSTEPPPMLERDGIRFGGADLGWELAPGESENLMVPASDCDIVAIVSSLNNSALEHDDGVVAQLRVKTTDGRIIQREIRAGVNSAEWAHDRADVLPSIRHRLAPVFEDFPGDEQRTFLGHRYWTQISLDQRIRVAQVEIQNVSQHASLHLSKITLFDKATGLSTPLFNYNTDRWEVVYQKDGVEVLRNKNAFPRLWLVAEAEAVTSEEALTRIRGESAKPFDPRRTALLEVSPGELPALPGGPVSPDASARLVVAESNRLTIDTASAAPALLVVSEVNYPGWHAAVDGHPAEILNTDYILRGVHLPAGNHQVTMTYEAPAARSGAVISLASLLTILAASIFGPSSPATRLLKRDRHRVQ